MPKLAISELIKQLSTDVAIAQERFCRDASYLTLPFIHSYPKNSCEIASTLFALALQHKYPMALIEVVEGYNSLKSQWHFWIEIDTVVVDITAHQFHDFETPLICMSPSPFVPEFPKSSCVSPKMAAARFPQITASTFESLAERLLS